MTSDDELREEAEEAAESVRITDRRRIDPETGRSERRPAARRRIRPMLVDAEIVDAADDAAEAQSAEVAELTETLQRGWPRSTRTTADRTNGEISESRPPRSGRCGHRLIDTLDDDDRAANMANSMAQQKAIADNLNAALTRLGVLRYGEVGDVSTPLSMRR